MGEAFMKLAIESPEEIMLMASNHLEQEFWLLNVRHLDEQHQRRAELPTTENRLDTNSQLRIPVITTDTATQKIPALT